MQEIRNREGGVTRNTIILIKRCVRIDESVKNLNSEARMRKATWRYHKTSLSLAKEYIIRRNICTLRWYWTLPFSCKSNSKCKRQECRYRGSKGTLTLILRRSRTGTVLLYTSTSNKRAARPKLHTESLTRDLKRMYSRLTLVRISIKLQAPRFFYIGTGVSLLSRERFLYI